MELNHDDVPYFVRFVLLDEAVRPPSGKRQNLAMTGFWMSRQGMTGMRGSDGRLRWRTCIEMFKAISRLSIAKAAAEVYVVLGRPTLTWVNRFRVEYYEQRASRIEDRGLLYGQFLSLAGLGAGIELGASAQGVGEIRAEFWIPPVSPPNEADNRTAR